MRNFHAVDIGLGLEIRANRLPELESKEKPTWQFWVGILLGTPVVVSLAYIALIAVFSQSDGFYP